MPSGITHILLVKHLHEQVGRGCIRIVVANLAGLVFFGLLQLGCKDLGIKPLPWNGDVPIEGQWQLIGFESDRITAVTVDPSNSKTIYCGTDFLYSSDARGRLLRTTDYGSSWDTLRSDLGVYYTKIVINPSDTKEIYCVTGALLKSTDGGLTWANIVNGINLIETSIASFMLNPSNPSTLFVGTSGIYGGSLYKSVNGGENWSQVLPDTLNDGVISLAMDPVDNNTLYAGTSWRGFLLRSTNGGINWTRTGLGQTNELIHDILIDRYNPTRIVVGINLKGVSMSEDAGNTWKSINEGLISGSSVRRIEQFTSNRWFAVATKADSGGIFESNLDSTGWKRIGLNDKTGSYYYVDFCLNAGSKDIYLGWKGLYRFRLE